jgi:hypothetical protein
VVHEIFVQERGARGGVPWKNWRLGRS